jgi:hypothetical protein
LYVSEIMRDIKCKIPFSKGIRCKSPNGKESHSAFQPLFWMLLFCIRRNALQAYRYVCTLRRPWCPFWIICEHFFWGGGEGAGRTNITLRLIIPTLLKMFVILSPAGKPEMSLTKPFMAGMLPDFQDFLESSAAESWKKSSKEEVFLARKSLISDIPGWWRGSLIYIFNSVKETSKAHIWLSLISGYVTSVGLIQTVLTVCCWKF